MDNEKKGRPTVEITTPNGHLVVLKEYLTPREANEIKRAMYSKIQMTPPTHEGGEAEVDKVPADFMIDQEMKAIELTVVSVDGKTENILSIILDGDLRPADYEAITKKITEIRGGNLTPAK